jgi:urease accessory protein
LVNGLVSAASRLGIIGHVEAQQSLETARRTLADLLVEALPDDIALSSFTPLIDIAVSRGKSRALRLFTT